MKRSIFALVIALVFGLTGASTALSQTPQLKTASTHPIEYYLSLPEGWSAEKKWPVVIVIDSAERQFSDAAAAFAQARGDRPFIIVAPLVVTNGGAGYRNVPTYHYSSAVWDRIQSDGQFKFDMDGITAIMQDVVKEYSGEDKYFITGLEAAGHTVWGVLFNHPEATRGAALICPNYLGRWVDEAHISTAPERTSLPIQNMVGKDDNLCSEGHPIYTQMQRAIKVAQDHGYKSVSLAYIEGKGHDRLADDVLSYFFSVLTNVHSQKRPGNP